MIKIVLILTPAALTLSMFFMSQISKYAKKRLPSKEFRRVQARKVLIGVLDEC